MPNYERLFNEGDYQGLIDVTRDMHDIGDKYWYAKANYHIGNIELATEVVDQFFHDKDKYNEEWNAKFINMKGLIYLKKGDTSKAKELFRDSLIIYGSIDDKAGIASQLNNLAAIHEMEGQLDKALEYDLKSLELRRDIGIKPDIASSLNNIGNIYANKGALNNALEYYMESLVIAEKLNNNRNLAYLLNNIGSLYSEKGEFNLALEYFQRSFKIKCNIGNSTDVATTLISIGDIYKSKQQYDISLDYLYRAKERLEINSSDKLVLAKCIVSIIEVQAIHDDTEKIDLTIAELNNINIKNSANLELYKQYSQAIRLKSSKRHTTKLKSVGIFENIISTNDFDFYILIRSLKHMIELLLLEYQLDEEKEVFNEIQKYIAQLQEIAEREQIVSENVSVFIIQSKLALIVNNFDKAYQFLVQAEEFIEIHQLKHYYYRIEDEKENLKKYICDLKKQLDDSSVLSLIEKTKIYDYLNEVGRISFQ